MLLPKESLQMLMLRLPIDRLKIKPFIRILLQIHHLQRILRRKHLHPLLRQRVTIMIRHIRHINILLPIQIHLRRIVHPITNQPYRESELTVVLVVVEDEDGGGVALPGVEVVFEVRDGARGPLGEAFVPVGAVGQADDELTVVD